MLLHRIFADDILALRQGPAGLVAGSERERIALLADRAARSALPVLIEAEPGSGAKALAQAIHDSSVRGLRSFAVLRADEAGPQADALLRLFKETRGGTLFIQGIERLTGDARALITDVLFRRGAASRAGSLDIRLIASAGVEPSGKGRAGEFEYALSIPLRPLRTQRETVAEWAVLFAERFATEEGKRISGLSPDALSLLARYDWPGNLQQLEKAVYRAVILADGAFLTSGEFPQIAAHVEGVQPEVLPIASVRAPQPLRIREPASQASPHALSLIRESGHMLTLAELEEHVIRFALVHYQGHMSAISRHLGIGRSTLYRKLKELGLNDEAA